MENQKVLLVDDDQDFREAVKLALENSGFTVVTANDGEAGLKSVKKEKPDLIILDVMMPKKDGYAVCYELKNNETTASIPVLMLTSLGSETKGKDGADVLAKGHKAEGYLEKPVESDMLVDKVKQLLKEAHAKKEDEQKIKVLLIDDDRDFLEAVKTILEENDYLVLSAFTGEEGLMSVSRNKPDLILLDVMLPETDGFAVCKEIKENPNSKGIPVVMLTSIGHHLTDPDYAKAVAVTHEADDFIEKPVEAKELLNRIRKFVGPTRRLV